MPTTGKLYLGDILISGGGAAPAEEWSRPADWLAMPTSVPQSIDILTAVFDHESNYCAVNISTSAGTYSVDWGDGTSDTGIASNVQVNHIYNYADLAGTESTRGYRQALIRITPDAGNISEVSLNARHSALAVAGVASPWLDVAVNAPNATVLSFYSTLTFASICERINLVAIGAVTSLASTFQNCAALQSVTFPSGSLSAVTGLNSAFQNCYALQSVTFPEGSLSAVTTLSNAFQNCTSLQSITFPAPGVNSGLSASLVTASSMFFNCPSLSEINNCTVPVTFTVASCRLSAAALNEIYTALPTVTSRIITVTGNVGVTGDNPTIATAKGWTVTG